MHETGRSGLVHWDDPEGWDGMGREVGGGFRMRTYVNPWLIYVNVWQKTLQYCKIVSLQLIKIIGNIYLKIKNMKSKKKKKHLRSLLIIFCALLYAKSISIKSIKVATIN